jgi:hypothetical protein
MGKFNLENFKDQGEIGIKEPEISVNDQISVLEFVDLRIIKISYKSY